MHTSEVLELAPWRHPCVVVPLQVVYLAGDTSDEEQMAAGSEDDGDTSEVEQLGSEGWSTDDEEGDSDENDMA